MTTDERVLVLMPTAKDGERTLKALAQAGLSGCICRDLHELCGEILKGASVALVPEEAIVNDRELCLQEVLSEQPPWSDFPLVVLAREGAEERGNHIRESMNSTLVERPVKFRSLVSVVRAAMRSRRHQYAIRDHLAERKRAEAFQALAAQSNAKFRAFFDRGLNFALVLALDGAVVEANRSCLESYGFAREEIIARPFWECGWWNRSPSLQDMIRSACARAAAGTLVRNETQYFNAAGEERFVELTIAPVRDESERILFIAATGSDVTERKRAEAQLHDIRSRMEAALAAGAIGTWTWEVASDRFFADQSLARMFALAMEDARGGPLQRIVDAVHPDDRTRVLAQIEKALSSGDRFEADYRVSQNDGCWRWVTARGKVERDENGRPTQFPGVAIDITERKQAEESLERVTAVSERRKRLYETALSNTPDQVYIFGLDHRFYYANEALLKIWGKSWDEAIGKTCLELGYEPSHAAMHDAEIETIVATKRPIRGEVPFTGTNGKRVYDYILVPVIGTDGSVEAVAGTTRDVTDRQRAEAENRRLLREVEAERARLADVFQNAPSFMCVLRGPEHIFERANDRYFELVARRDIIGKSVREAVPEVAGQGFFEILDRVYRTGEPFICSRMQIELLRGDRLEERVLDFVYQPMRDATGSVSGILVHGIDLTERARAEGELIRLTAETERQRRIYETALSNNADFNYVFDLRGRFTFVNRSLLALWQKEFSEVSGKTLFELDYPRDLAAKFNRQIREVIASKQPLRDETPYTSAFGTRAYEYILVPVFGADGSVEAVAGSTRDITDRKQAEQALREADRRKDEFIAMLAHELRNPLAPIRNGLQVMRLAEDRATRDRSQQMMDRQLSHMVRLIDDLLDVSRISRNKMELRLARLSLADAIRSAVETARPAISEASHELTVSLSGKPIYLNADLTRLSQVFSNLLNNSAKYTPNGGRIWLTVERGDREVCVSVRDNGIGIPASSLASIFDMFSQVDRSIERSKGGLGIGLALVKGLVEMHGGRVDVKSEGEGKGSTFTVTLPLASELVKEDLPSLDNPKASLRRRILVVDDNEDGADSLATMLSLLGNEVRTAHDGLDAIEQAERFLPDVILMDVGMPRLNGLDATRRIRPQPWGRGMTIIALTGWGQETDRQKSREAGCDGHLVKPVTLVDLQKLLGELQLNR